MLTNSTKRQTIHVFEIVRSVKMVQWRYEERLAISRHYKVRGVQPICIHQQSFHFVNKCCLAKNLMKSLDFSLLFCIQKQANLEEIVECVWRILELCSKRVEKAEVSYFSTKIILVNTNSCWILLTLGEVVKP